MYRPFLPLYFDSGHFRSNLDKPNVLVLDGGSRGSLFEPFSAIRQGIDILAFDPDPNEAQYDISKGTVQFVNSALWDSAGQVDVHLAHDPSTSSVYPPNERLLKCFPDYIGFPVRRTEKVLRVSCTSVDSAVEANLCGTPDFIKLDIHSAEYEALRGAEKSLSDCVGVMVESWHSPIHKGQHLHGEVEAYLNRQGFHLFNMSHVMSWKRAVDGQEFMYDESQVVGSESLFFRDFSSGPPVSARMALIAIACADLFRYTGYAIQLSRVFHGAGVFSKLFQAEVETALRDIERLRRKKLVFSRTNIKRLGMRLISKVATTFPP